jgi:RimJ/RimL family protein N-acetyltransferase
MQKFNFTPFPNLTTNRLILRQLSENDSEEIFSLRTDKSVNKYLDRQIQRNSNEVIEFINNINKSIYENKSVYWAICLKDKNKFLGTICLFGFCEENMTAELGYELHPNFQKKGIMNESLNAVIEFSFSILKLDSIDASVHKNNDSSIKLLEKNNFVLELNRADEENINLVVYKLMKKSEKY